MTHTVLIYSINQENISFYKKGLHNLNCKLSLVDSYTAFEKYLLSEAPQIVIMDLELDNTDAITVTKEIKSGAGLIQPFIIVCSNKSDDFIEISALNSGADEFIELPLNHLIFESKMKALCKRLLNGKESKMTKGLYIDQEEYKIYLGARSHTLPRLEFKLLNLLFSQPNRIFSKDEIAAQIWNNKDISTKRTIDIHIRNIRKELGENIIKTYRGLGYCLKLND